MELTPATIREILSRHTDVSQDTPLYELADGRLVIETVIDTKNHAHFVVRNPDTTCELIDGQSVYVAKDLQPPHITTITISKS